MIRTKYDSFFEELGIPEEKKLSYAQLLRYLHTPKNVNHLKKVLERFIETYSGAWLEEISIDDEMVDYTHNALNIAHSLLSAGKSLPNSHNFCGVAHKKIPKKNPKIQRIKSFTDPTKLKLFKVLHGTFQSNPYYPIHYLLNKENANFFKWLRQVLFVIPWLVKDKTISEEQLELYEPVKLGRFFRQMTEQPEALCWLAEQDCTQCRNLKTFIGWLYKYRYYFKHLHGLSIVDLNSRGMKSSSDKKQEAIGRYHEISECIKILEIPLGHRKKRRATITRRPTGRSPSDLVPLHGVTALEGDTIVQLETLPDEHDNNNVLYSVLQVQLEDELIQAGEEIYEQQQDEMYIFADHEPMESYIAAFHGRRLSKAVMRRLERQHQYLTTDRRCLSNTQVFQLLTWCKQEKVDNHTAEAAMVAALAFFSASLPSNLFATSDALHNEGFPKLDLDTPTMVLPVFSVLYATQDTKPDKDDKLNLNQEIKPANCQGLNLPMPNILQRAFIEHSRQSDFLWAQNNKPLNQSRFCRPNQELQKIIQTQTGLEISAHQIANHLFLKACALFGSASATLMFNRPAPGSQARLYYTSLTNSLIKQRYHELIKKVMLDAGLEPPEMFKKPTDEMPFQIGCRNPPAKSDYRTLLSSLRDELNTLRKNVLSTDWITFHNRFTAYCIVTQGLLTGIRPTHDGFITFDNMLLDAKVAIIRDKDSADEYHTRTVPLHPIAIKIAQAYNEHILAILGRLHRIGLLKKWQLSGQPHPFFFTNIKVLDNSYNVAIMPFRPKLLSKEIEPYFTLPPNSNRKLLRSLFETKGISPLCIDALLGHGNLGETFWHQHNTLSLQEIRLTLFPHLDELAESLEIRAIQGITS